MGDIRRLLCSARWLLVLTTLVLACCGSPDYVLVLVNVQQLPNDVRSLQLNVTKNGQPAIQTIQVTQNLSRVALKLTDVRAATGNLEVELLGLDDTGCESAEGRASVSLVQGVLQYEVSVFLAQRITPLCAVTVNIIGDGTVSAPGTAINGCGTAGTACTGKVPKNSSLTLAAERNPVRAYAIGWGAPCNSHSYESKSDCSLSGITKPITLTAEFAPRICSSGGWCWYNPLPQGNTLIAIWGSDAQNVWAVGSSGAILKWNGTTWVLQASGTTQNLRGVWGLSASSVWAVGEKGTILRWDGSTWIIQNSGTLQDLRGIWGVNENNIWISGSNGTILKWNGISWAAQQTNTTEYLHGIWGTTSSNIWAVGGNGTIVRFNGGSWLRQTTGTTETFGGVWGHDDRNLWAVGTGGIILKWDGFSWSKLPSVVTQILEKPWLSDDLKTGWAVGGGDSCGLEW